MDARLTLKRMRAIREKLIIEYPFFGELIYKLQLCVLDDDEESEGMTACTDATHLMFAPAFAERLTDEEMEFVFMHEVMHCALQHCSRRNGRDSFIWNVACDLVVNSNILISMGLDEFNVNQNPVMHTIDNKEAAHYTADEIYDMLFESVEEKINLAVYKAQILDDHDDWESADEFSAYDWEEAVMEAVKKYKVISDGKGSGTPLSLLEQYEKHNYKSSLKWKQLLRDFIRYNVIDEDYGYRPPDRRFMDNEILYPGLNNVDGETVEKVLIFIDKSGSIDTEELQAFNDELSLAFKEAEHMSGLLSFFDCEVSEPMPFEGLKEYLKIGTPIPMGGTSFHSVFDFARKNYQKILPRGIIVMTDGYALFPEHNPLPNVPVLWVFVNNNSAKPTFGKAAYIQTRGF